LAYVASHTPDLAIVDLRLPDMNGCRLCLELRNRYQVMMVPVVMLTPPGATTDEAYGADAYLTKPIDPAAVITTIAGLMG
jgi:DNA-binding response OmpR family regulator